MFLVAVHANHSGALAARNHNKRRAGLLYLASRVGLFWPNYIMLLCRLQQKEFDGLAREGGEAGNSQEQKLGGPQNSSRIEMPLATLTSPRFLAFILAI